MSTTKAKAPRFLFLVALRAAAGRVPVWLFCWFVLFAFAAAVAGPWIGWFDGAGAHHYEVGSLRDSLSETFRFDHAEEMATLRQSSARWLEPMALFMMLLYAFAAGGWLQIFLERTSGRSLRRFLWGGARYFVRFFRVLVLSLGALSLVTWLCHGWVWKTLVLEFLFGAEGGDLEALGSELTVAWLTWAQAGVYALLFALVMVWGDYTRTRLALHNTRSAIWAGLCSIGLILTNPVKTLRPMALITAVEVLLVQALAIPAWGLNTAMGPEAGAWTLVALLALGQLAMAWQIISRGARYYAAVGVTRELSPPVRPPDRWGNRVGGPGGPQYPVDDSDDYGVAI